jgi:hypothetical protein
VTRDGRGAEGKNALAERAQGPGKAPELSLGVQRTPVNRSPGNPGRFKAVNTVAVLTEQGLAGPWCYQGAMTARVFVAYLETFLLPLLRTGKTLILDNHPVHRSRRVQAFLKRHHIRVVFLPVRGAQTQGFLLLLLILVAAVYGLVQSASVGHSGRWVPSWN